MTGYTVNHNGAIEIPYIGEVTVKGKTLKEAKAAVDTEVSNSLRTITCK